MHNKYIYRILGSASIPLKNVINSGEQSHTLTGPGEDGAVSELNVRKIIAMGLTGGTVYMLKVAENE